MPHDYDATEECMRFCIGCGQAFIPIRNKQIWCSRACNNRENAKKRYHADPNTDKLRVRAWKKNNKGRKDYINKKSYLKTKYGLSIEDYEAMFVAQNYKCAICGQHRKLDIDHCHTTNKIRGLLCGNCNKILGLAYENKETLLAAINYIKRWE